MSDENDKLPACKTLWMHFREGLRRANAQRPVSFYLLLAIPLILLLGVSLLDVSAGPRAFGLRLILIFILFFLIVVRAVFDFFDISRKHFRESHRLFGATLGDKEFLSQVSKRSDEQRKG